jgi:hypothetical protein
MWTSAVWSLLFAAVVEISQVSISNSDDSGASFLLHVPHHLPSHQTLIRSALARSYPSLFPGDDQNRM